MPHKAINNPDPDCIYENLSPEIAASRSEGSAGHAHVCRGNESQFRLGHQQRLAFADSKIMMEHENDSQQKSQQQFYGTG